MLHIAIPLQSPLRAAAPAPPRSRAPRPHSHLPSGSAGRDEKEGGGRGFIFTRGRDGTGGVSPPRGAPLTAAASLLLQARPEMPGRRLWWARCWFGVCLSLLGAGGGGEPCRAPSCGGEAPPAPCRGARCGPRAGRPARSFPHTATPLRPPQGKAPPAGPHPAARGSAAEPCPAGGCAANGTRRDCHGLECRLPPRLRPRPRGPGCSAAAEGCPEPALLRAADRAAQFAGDDFAYAGPELGGGALGVQLTCDVKPGAGRRGAGPGGRRWGRPVSVPPGRDAQRGLEAEPWRWVRGAAPSYHLCAPLWVPSFRGSATGEVW